MFHWLRPAQPPEVWLVKQIDDDLLHLCGRGLAIGKGRPKAKRQALQHGSYRGPLRLAGSGLVLNADLFEALVPLEALEVDDDDQAHWRGRTWRVSWVPQRCLTYRGRLTIQGPALSGDGLVSTEDVSTIREKAAPQARPTSPTLWAGLEGRDER